MIHLMELSSLLLTTIVVLRCNNVQAELKLLNVVFRHGDRAPDAVEMYAKDPNKDNPFEPMELGGLTNSGEMREYVLGAHLRKTYGDFLGDIFHRSEVSARSTNSDRTKMSLQLVLAALYPPKAAQKWNDELNWQPVPATYMPALDDILMIPEWCPKYLKARAEAEASEDYRKKLQLLEPLMKNLTEETGTLIENSYDMYNLWFDLMAEYAMNLTLPKWAYNVFPTGKLLEGINLEYELASFNEEMKRLNGGMFLRKFIDDMVLYTQKDESIKKQRIKLYSGHESNVAALLQALGVYTPHPPDFSSAVFIELHHDNDVFSVKVKHYKGIPSEAEEMSIEECGSPCTLENFAKALSNVIPSDEDLECDKRSLADKLENDEIRVAPKFLNNLKDALAQENKTRGSLL